MEGLAALPTTRSVLLGAMELLGTQTLLRALGNPAHVSKPVMPDELQAAILLTLEGRKPAAPPPPASQIPPRRLRVLVAEDNDLNQQLMRQLLTKRGDELTVVGDGRQALAQIESSSFDVLLLDVHLPEIDGLK
jgi:PleD family two-component response regulator